MAKRKLPPAERDLRDRVRKRHGFERITGWAGYKPYHSDGYNIEEIWRKAIEEFESETQETYTPTNKSGRPDISDPHVMYKKQLKRHLGKHVKVTTYVEGKQVHSVVLDVPSTLAEFNRPQGGFWSRHYFLFTEYRNGIQATVAWHELADKYPVEQINARAGSVTIAITPETKLEAVKVKQNFREGICNCFLTPIRNWAETKLDEVKSQRSIRRYRNILSKLGEYEAKYIGGVPEADLQTIANDLQIDISVEFPLKDAGQYIKVESMKKGLNKFHFKNTRMDHVDLDRNRRYADKKPKHNKLTDRSGPKKVTEEELLAIRDDLDRSGTHYTYTKDKDGCIILIESLLDTWDIGSEYKDAVNAFEKETGLVNYKLDFKADREVSKFIDSGVHYNETKDFVNIDAVDRDALRHIDMERAYARFFNCRHYAGFPGKITDFRECRDVNIEFVRENLGYYLIENLRTDGVDPM